MRTVDDDLQTTSWAAFANAIFALSDTVNLSAGVRYTEEEKELLPHDLDVQQHRLFFTSVPSPSTYRKLERSCRR